jgi:hypothetical protein
MDVMVNLFARRRLIRVKHRRHGRRRMHECKRRTSLWPTRRAARGLRCAVAYLGSNRDVYGWFIGPRLDLTTASCYFLLADFFTALPARYEAVDQADLHSAWSLEEPRRPPPA